MGLDSARFLVGTVTPVKLVAADNESVHAHLHIEDKNSNNYVYVGGSATVGTATGFAMHSDIDLAVTLPAGQALWGIADADNVGVSVLRISN